MPMDRADRIGTGVSAAVHLGLIAWVAFGGDLFRARPADPVVMTEVSVMSEAEFAAMMAAAPRPSDLAVSQPQAPSVAQDAAPAPQPDPGVAAEAPPAPMAEPEPETAPDMSDLTTPPAQAQVTEAPPMQPMPPVEEPSATVLMEISPRPRPRPAPRVAPTPAEAPPPDAQVSDMAQAETRPDEAAAPEETVEAPEPEAAPPEATTEIVTEATETDDRPQSSAPLTSARPRARPAQPAPARPAPQVETASRPTPPAATPSQSDAVADALAEALASDTGTGTGGVGRAASGPPLTSGEKDALIVDVKACWNVGALSTEALRTVVTLGVTMMPDGRPDVGSIRRISHEGGSEAAANQAFEAGRRAIVRCGSDGFPLPPEKYDHWREIEIVFNPEKMRMK